MVTIRQLLDQKGGEVCSIHPDSTVFDAVAKMAENEKVPSKKKGTDATAAPKPKQTPPKPNIRDWQLPGRERRGGQ